jgi:hypothetical protein
LHDLAFPLWGVAAVHGIAAGTDSGAPWAITLYLLTTATVIFLSAFRLLTAGRRQRRPPTQAVQSKVRAAEAER